MKGKILLIVSLVAFIAIIVACAPALPPAPTVALPTAGAPPPGQPTSAPPTAPAQATSAPTTAPAPSIAAPTFTSTPAVATGAFPIFNLCPSCTPKSGGDVKAFLTDFWMSNVTIWNATAWINAKRLVFNTLLTHTDPSLTQFKPELAEKWDLSADGTTVTFHLRQGVKWQDGAAFTAKDVDYTIRAFVHPDTGSTVGAALKLDQLVGAKDFMSGKANQIAGVKVVDDSTIELKTEQPVGFLFNLTQLIILPEHILGSVPYKDLVTNKFTQNWVGTGPFKFVRRVPGQFVELARFDNYWGGKPYLDRMLILEYSDTDTAALAFEKGDADLVMKISGPNLERLRKLPDSVIVGAPVDFPNELAFNFQKPYLQDKRVRQALVWAIDINAIKNALYGDTVRLTVSPLPSSLWEKKDLPNAYSYDPSKARELLKAANWNPDQSIELSTYYSDQTSSNLLTAIQKYWSDVGVKSTIRLIDVASVFQQWTDGKFDVSYIGGQGSADPDLLSAFVGCKTTPEQGFTSYGSNFWRYCNKDLDALFAKARNIADYNQRKALYDQIQVLMNDELPFAPVWVPIRLAAIKKWVVNGNWAQDFADGDYSQEYEKWYLSK
jgi:peptide/nickel transport system substrate-binding protein